MLVNMENLHLVQYLDTILDLQSSLVRRLVHLEFSYLIGWIANLLN